MSAGSDFAAERFPPLDEATLFLASSSDVKHVRLTTGALLSGLLNRIVTDRPVKTFDWESCVAETPFDLRLNMQENLPRPSDPNCVGALVFIGERIGCPLRDFNVSIPNWTDWSDSHRRYRVVREWPDDPVEQWALVERGCFPLTGTVFETLDALGAEKPVYLGYFADRAMTGDEFDVRLNGWLWRTEVLRQLADTDVGGWMSRIYAVQTGAVRNFVNALTERGRYVAYHPNAQSAYTAAQQFVVDLLSRRMDVDVNPYQFLDFYGIDDASDFPGRAAKTEQVVAELRSRASDPDGPPMIARIRGESGCGKTSFMRAGVLAALRNERELGRFCVIAVRPTEFHDPNGLPDRHILVCLLNLIARELPDIPLTPAAITRVQRGAHRAAQIAVDVLEQALAARGPDAPRLIIGIDQFEEIVDDLAAIDRRSYAAAWKPLLAFVALASKSSRFGFLYTLEETRVQAFNRPKLIELIPRVIHDAYEVRLGGHDDSFLEAIITRPFGKAGYRLDPRIVNELLLSYKTYSSSNSSVSLLPLLSLKLSNLFDTARGVAHRRSRGPSGDGIRDQFGEMTVEISYDDLKDQLRLDNEIEELANTAWGVDETSEAEQLSDLNFVLQPLVALSDEDDRITLQTVGDVKFSNLRGRLAAFEEVRLIVRDNGRQRLVHEAVIRQWPLAAKWLAMQREYLVDEAEFRNYANVWVMRGQDPSRIPGTEAHLDTAAGVLRNYLHEWPYCEPSELSPGDLNLMKYCQAVFRTTKTPRRSISKGFLAELGHVHLAAAYGMSDLVERLITDDPGCIDLVSGRNKTPLDNAAWHSAETVQLLIGRGANARNVDKNGWPTIAAAVWQGNREIFEILRPYYRSAADIQTPNQSTLLHIAARRGQIEMADMILNTVTGADPNQEDEWGRTALDYAACYDQPKAISFFLDSCDPVHRSARNGYTLLHWAAYSGSLQAVNVILDLPEFHDLVEATTTEGETALMIAAALRHDGVVRRLVEVMAPNRGNETGQKAGWTALHYAVAGNGGRETRRSRQRALRTVRALLAASEIDPRMKDAEGREPITLVNALPEVRSELLSSGKFTWTEPLSDGDTPLNHLIKAKDRIGVERLLRISDLDVETLSSDGSYALHLMISNEMEDIALRLFQAARVRPWQMTGAKEIGFAHAVAGRHELLVSAFLDALPDVLQPEQRQHLTQAARSALIVRNERLFDTLLQHGIEPLFGLNQMKWTLLHIAALVGDIPSFDRLSAMTDMTFHDDLWGRPPSALAPDAVKAEFDERIGRMRGAP